MSSTETLPPSGFSAPRWRPSPVVAVFVAAAALYLLGATSRSYWAPDEPDFAQHTREMFERRDFLVPYENGKPYGEKPILFYWAMTAGALLGGGAEVPPWSTRLASVVSGAALAAGAAWFARRRGGDAEAWLAGAMTAVSPLVFWQSQFLQIDQMFTTLLAIGLAAIFLVDDDPARSRRWVWVAHVSLSLATLTKGPLAVVLPGLVILVRAALRRSWEPVWATRPARGAFVWAAIVVPWYVAAARAGGPEYAYNLVVHQNWNRFFHAFDHIKPWWFYLTTVWGDFFPWMLLTLPAGVWAVRTRALAERPDLRYAMTAALTILAFLSASGAKQGKYVLVIFPAFSLLVAAYLRKAEGLFGQAREPEAWARWILRGASWLFVAAGVALVPVSRWKGREFPDAVAAAPVMAAILGLGGLACLAWSHLRPQAAGATALVFAGAMAAGEAGLGLVVFPALDLIKTGAPFYDRIGPLVASPAPLAEFAGTFHSAPILYLRRKVEHFRTEPELIAWLKRTPGALVLVDESIRESDWKDPYLLSGWETVDRQRVGGDAILLLRRGAGP